MTAGGLLSALASRGVTLAPAGDRLTYDAPPGALDVALLDAMRAHRDELLRLVRARRALDVLASRRRISAAVDALGIPQAAEARRAGERWRDVATDYGVGRAALDELVRSEVAAIAAWRAGAEIEAAAPCSGCGWNGPGCFVVATDGVVTCAGCLTGEPS